jgi:hypothetical protein
MLATLELLTIRFNPCQQARCGLCRNRPDFKAFSVCHQATPLFMLV